MDLLRRSRSRQLRWKHFVVSVFHFVFVGAFGTGLSRSGFHTEAISSACKRCFIFVSEDQKKRTFGAEVFRISLDR